MKIKNQFLVSILIFGIILAVLVGSVLVVQQQTNQWSNQEAISQDIQTRSNSLAYISNDYFLYQDSSQLSLWQTEFSSLSADISKLNVSNPEQQTLLNNTKSDAQRLNDRWTDVVSYLATAPRNESVRVLPAFQADWSRMTLQNQALIFDSQQLSQSLRSQVDQLNLTSLILIFSLLGLFGAYFITNYLLTYRSTLKSIAELQAGIAVIGSGDLNHILKADKKDEIGEISQSFNQMTQNLKTVTASKIDLEQAQTSLRKSEQRWATTLSSIGDSVIATDAAGYVTFMNAIAEKLTGWKLSEALGKPLKDIFYIINEETRQQVESPVTKVLEKGMIVGLANHTILLRRDGGEVPLDDSGAPIKDQNGNVSGIVLVFHDISERKKAEEATQKQAELIDLSPDAIIVRRIDGTITFWSEGAEKLYGWTKDEAIGQNINELLQTDLPKSPIDVQNQLKKDGTWSGEIVHFCKDGSKLVVQSYWLAKFGSDGEIYEMLESNVDITERIQMQLKLEESAVRLEEYANQMETLANQRAAQLKDAERLAAIGATAGMVGHDIRNPLQAITSDLYLAKTELETLPVSEQKNSAIESLDEIQKNIDYINKIVADLQDYARPLKPTAKGTDLENLCRDVFLKSNIPNNIKASFKAEKEAKEVMADPDLIRRIISNLVLNAIQAMPNGGELSVYAFRKEGGLVIEVKDTGEGIPDEVKGKLFTPMFTTKSKGQGFGLAVVKRVTEAMNGTVSFESEQGKGTIFIVRLPPPPIAKR